MPRRQKLIFATMVAAGIGFFVVAGLIGNGGDDDTSVLNNPAIDNLIPGRGDEVLQQQSVGIDLAPKYRLVSLTISPDARCTRPVDVTGETRYVEGLQQYIFTPGAGRLVEALSADFNCARAVFEEISQPGQVKEIEWAFTVN